MSIRHTPRRRRLVVAVAVAGSLILAACGGGGSSSDRGDDVLRVGELLDISDLDPAKGNAGYDHIKLYPMFDTLLSYSADELLPEPGLAESWEFVDPTTLRLELNTGITFHDGTPFDAAAVKVNLDRILDTADPDITIRGDLASVASVAAVDEDTVDILLKTPNSALPLILADRAGMMVSPDAIAAGTVSETPVGTGPYQFVEWRPGDRVVLERFDDYWGGTPKLQGIEFRIIPDDSTRLNALRSGEIDFANALAASDYGTVQDADGLESSSSPTVAFWTLYLNPSQAPLDDVKVRQAINLALDREALMLSSHPEGDGEVAYGLFPEASWAYSDELAPYYEHDLEAAQALMAESKYPDGASLEIVLPPGAEDQRRMEIVQSQLAEIGITVELRPLEQVQGTATFFDEKAVPVYHNQWTGRTDPALTMQLLFGQNGYFNVAKVDIPGFADAMQGALTSTDLDERAAAIVEAEKAVAEAGMIVPLYFVQRPLAWKDSLSGVTPNLLGKPKFDQVSFK